MRPNKHKYYLDIALAVAKRSTCLRRCYGAVIVNNDEVIATGYTGAPRGTSNCTDLNKCLRNELNITSGQNYELCRSVHAETNAIISTSRKNMIGSTMYVVGFDPYTQEILFNTDSCIMCKRIIINAGIKNVVYHNSVSPNQYIIKNVLSWINNDSVLTKSSREK